MPQARREPSANRPLSMTLQIKVIPRAPKTELAGTMADGTLKVRIAAPPDQGKANAELIRFLASHYKVPESDIKILSGQTSTRKLVRIGG